MPIEIEEFALFAHAWFTWPEQSSQFATFDKKNNCDLSHLNPSYEEVHKE